VEWSHELDKIITPIQIFAKPIMVDNKSSQETTHHHTAKDSRRTNESLRQLMGDGISPHRYRHITLAEKHETTCSLQHAEIPFPPLSYPDPLEKGQSAIPTYDKKT
jgi:hypothetical protein